MAIGTNRIYMLVPTDCAGHWGFALAEIFGCTVYDPGGGAFVLRSVSATITSAAGVSTVEPVHNGAAFLAPWIAAGSVWNPGTGVLTLQRAGGFAAGDQLMLTVCSRDGAGDDTYSTWYVGIGDAPDLAEPPALEDRVLINGKHFRITALVGVAGSIRYQCEPTDHTMAGMVLARRNDFEYVSPRGRLDARVLLSE